MKSILKLLVLGITTMFLLQSCVTVRPLHHHHHRHRHCIVVEQPTSNTIFSDFSIADYLVTSEFIIYGNNG